MYDLSNTVTIGGKTLIVKPALTYIVKPNVPSINQYSLKILQSLLWRFIHLVLSTLFSGSYFQQPDRFELVARNAS